ncbi:MAG: hypothetical protein P9X24_10930 [Candidatus Hatepunaea meridiana]|nr:hypothetical protein [Candidatus Hatepunaea meridiana]
MTKNINRRVEGAYLTEAKQDSDCRMEDLRRLLKAILIRRRKCSLKIHFDGKRFHWDFTAPDITADDLWKL